MKKILSVIVVTLLTAYAAMSQNDIQLTQQQFSRITFNPAATGQSNYLNAAIFHRSQWLGFDNAPVTQVVNIHKYFSGPRFGLGLNIVNDKIGNESVMDIKFAYAYHVWLNDNMILSLGAGIGVMNRSIDATDLRFDDPSDPNALIDEDSKTKPDFDFGIEFNTPRLTIGASSTHINQGIDKATVFQAPRHIFLYTKYTISASESVDIVPSLSLSNIQNVNLFEVSAVAFLKDKLHGGLAYRVDDAIALMAGITILKRYTVGYSYDISSGSLKSYSDGSHEIMISAKLGAKPVHQQSPRFFD